MPYRFSYKSHLDVVLPEHVNFSNYIRCCIFPTDTYVLRIAYKYPLVTCAVSLIQQRCMSDLLIGVCLLTRASAATPDRLLISVKTLPVCMLGEVPANTQGTNFPLTCHGEESS